MKMVMMRGYLIYVLPLFIQVVFCLRKSPTEDDSMISSFHGNFILPLQHSFGMHEKFSRRGSIKFRNMKSSFASMTTEVELNPTEMQKLDLLVEEDGLYFIRTPAKIGGTFTEVESDDEVKYVSTFVKACYLHGSGLQEAITIAVDYAGNIIGLSIVSPQSECLKSTMNQVTSFNTTIHVQHQVVGAVPDTQSFVKRIKEEKADKAAGTGKDSKSFIAKYWMYIVPAILLLMFRSQAEPETEDDNDNNE